MTDPKGVQTQELDDSLCRPNTTVENFGRTPAYAVRTTHADVRAPGHRIHPR
jgi:hypothetical protein